MPSTTLIARPRRSSSHLEATHWADLEITLTGSYVRAEPDVGLGEGVEDQDIQSATISRRVRQHGAWVTKDFDILAGLDPKSRAVVVENILNALGFDTVADALVLEAR